MSAVVVGSRRSRSERWIVLTLLVPGLLALAVTFLAPLVWLLRVSFASSAFGATDPADWSLGAYKAALLDPFYWKVALNTLGMGVAVTIFAVTLSYPVALFLSRTRSRWRGVLTAMAVAPLLTSTVVRTYGWMVILGDQGVVNEAFKAIGLIERSLPLSNNSFGAAVALIQILMPYAILAMLSGFGRLSSELEEAAAMLGANPWRVFWRVVFPLSLPGVLTAALLEFVLTISAFVTPALMGGGRVFVLGTEVYSEATITLNWPLAAALSVALLVVFGGVIVLYQRALRALEW